MRLIQLARKGFERSNRWWRPRILEGVTAEAPLVVYGLQPGVVNFGVERMALATLNGLRPDYRVLLLAPDGPTHQRALGLGVPTRSANGPLAFARAFVRLLVSEPRLVFITGSIEQSLIAGTMNLLLRRRLAHVHVAHGGPEPIGFESKRWLNWIPCHVVAVSEYVKSRLIAYGVEGERVRVVENFLDVSRARRLGEIVHATPRRVERVLVLVKLEPWKRPHLILDALDRRPELRALDVRVVGGGDLLDELRTRAQSYPNVVFVGFSEHVDDELCSAGLLVHPNPEEPFGLVVIEAMFAGVPVLVPDRGGAADLVRPGVTGYTFAADDSLALAGALATLGTASPVELESVAQRAAAEAAQRFEPAGQLQKYRALFEPLLDRAG